VVPSMWGEGVPKNYIQQLGPVSDLLFQKESGHRYAFQITTDDPKWGGLSGCTFEEAKSWGKIEKGSDYAAAYVDATIALLSWLEQSCRKEERFKKEEDAVHLERRSTEIDRIRLMASSSLSIRPWPS